MPSDRNAYLPPVAGSDDAGFDDARAGFAALGLPPPADWAVDPADAAAPLASPDPQSPVAALFRRWLNSPGPWRSEASPAATSPHSMAAGVARLFARIPYENLSKIVKYDQVGRPELARRGPVEVFRDHLTCGAGGTCFSLTAAMLHALRALGIACQPILADRRYGPDTHCALLAWFDGRPHLLDPGYLIVDPIPLFTAGEFRRDTPFNQLLLIARDAGQRIELFTISPTAACSAGAPRYRLTYRTSPVDEGEFLRAWDASFDWDMMQHAVLTRVSGDRQLYLQDARLQERSPAGAQRRELSPDELGLAIAGQFDIDRRLAEQALRVLRRQRGLPGAAASATRRSAGGVWLPESPASPVQAPTAKGPADG